MINTRRKATIKVCSIVLFCAIVLFTTRANAQPEPGDVFKEYVWSCMMGDPHCNCGGGTFRVGHNSGAQNPTAPVNFAKDVDIDGAIKAEVVLEISRCHGGTKDLKMSVNGNEWIDVTIPFPDYADYMGYYFPVTAVPIGQIKAGTNTISLRVNDCCGNPWPQLLYSGAHLRVYYNPDTKAHVGGKITSPASGAMIGESQKIVCEPGSGSVNRIEFIGHYRGVNWESDGVYTQWHHVYYHGKLNRHIGTAQSAPYAVTWNTEWIANQPDGLKLAARVVADDGTIFMTPAVKVGLCRTRYDVEVCQITATPKDWVTRGGGRSITFTVEGDVSKIIGAKVYSVTWGDFGPLANINGTPIGRISGGSYDFRFGILDIDEATARSAFKSGDNTLNVEGGGHHGAEIMYPGPMPVVKYEASNDCPIAVNNTWRPSRADRNFRVLHSADAIAFIAGSSSGCEIHLVKVNGAKVAAATAGPLGTHTISASKLVNGVYLLKIREGQTETIRRISIAR
jgi:hypothetical protein